MPSFDGIHVIVLAGGKGTRMKSDGPKVLTLVGGAPIIARLLDALSPLSPRPTVVVGHKGEEVIAALGDRAEYVWQHEQLGTGHAVQCARSSLQERKDIKTIVVVPGDHPLLTAEALESVLRVHEGSGAAVTLGTVIVPSYEGDFAVFSRFGRVLRDARGEVVEIREFKDASDEERAIREVNVSYYCFDARWLWSSIGRLGNENAASEFYLTDMVALARKDERLVRAVPLPSPHAGIGVNTLEELQLAEKYSPRAS